MLGALRKKQFTASFLEHFKGNHENTIYNLTITNTFFKHKPIHLTTWQSPAPYLNITDYKTKKPVQKSNRLYFGKKQHQCKSLRLKSHYLYYNKLGS